jgi:hypothetical protein
VAEENVNTLGLTEVKDVDKNISFFGLFSFITIGRIRDFRFVVKGQGSSVYLVRPK